MLFEFGNEYTFIPKGAYLSPFVLQLTLADLSVFETWTMPLQLHPDAFDGHPEIQAHRTRVEKHENLADYIRNRPVRPV